MKLPKEPHRRALWQYQISVLSVGLLILAYYLVVRAASLHLPCIFAWTTHLYCPGCGCTRALGALLRLDFIASFSYNPTVLFVLGILIYYEWAFWRSARQKGGEISPVPLYLGCFVLLFYAVLRNILLVGFGIDPLGELIVFWS